MNKLHFVNYISKKILKTAQMVIKIAYIFIDPQVWLK